MFQSAELQAHGMGKKGSKAYIRWAFNKEVACIGEVHTNCHIDGLRYLYRLEN